MSFRFFRRKRIAPGVTLNLSKSGPSISLGPRGLKTTFGPRGTRFTVGIPGTGLYYTQESRRKSSAKARQQNQTKSAANRLRLGWLARRRLSKEEAAWVDGCLALLEGDAAKALFHLENSQPLLVDSAYLIGFIHLQKGRWAKARKALEYAAQEHQELGKLFGKYGLTMAILIPITEHIATKLEPDQRGVILGLVECLQHQGHDEEAIDYLEQLHENSPDDTLILLSLVELLLDTKTKEDDALKRIISLTANIENESPIHAALMLYKAQSLCRYGMNDAALATLTPALRRRKDYPPALLREIRYERALVYDALGAKARAKKDWERLFTEDPDYADVASRLGLRKEKPKSRG